MKKRLDLTGERFGKLTVIKEVGRNKHNKSLWECHCDCGGLKITSTPNLRSGKTNSCGCLQRPIKILAGMRFNRWTVTGMSINIKNVIFWLCVCNCGTERLVRSNALLMNTSKSCGCLKIEKAKEGLIDITGYKFNRLTVVGRDNSKLGRKKVYWLCRCDCGNPNLVSVTKSNLDGSTKSCGCLNKELSRERGKNSLHNLVGQKFGKLTVLSRVENNKNEKNARWLCKCDCGRRNPIVRGTHLERGVIDKCYTCARGGVNHPLYNPNITDEERLMKRNYPEYSEWRGRVFGRDKRKCQICGSSENINAHHILNYSKYRELRTDIDNGITLCEDCHMEFHSIYGRKNNNKEQLDEYTEMKLNVISKSINGEVI